MVLGLGKSREEKRFEKEADIQEPYAESSDEAIARDAQAGNQPKANYPSDMIPEDFYTYKRFISLPEAQAKHPDLVDKDVVFANLGGAKPSVQELEFQAGTISLFKSEFGVWKDIFLKDEQGNVLFEKVTDDDGVVHDVPFSRKVWQFDENFRDSLDFLETSFKFAVVASRAMGGSERAANLDVSTNTRISKEFQKKKEKTNSLWGTGGGS